MSAHDAAARRLLDRANAAGRPTATPTPKRAAGRCPECDRWLVGIEVAGPRAYLVPEHRAPGRREPCPAEGLPMPAVVVRFR